MTTELEARRVEILARIETVKRRHNERLVSGESTVESRADLLNCDRQLRQIERDIAELSAATEREMNAKRGALTEMILQRAAAKLDEVLQSKEIPQPPERR